MTQYFQVLRDYRSEQRPRIGHGYKAGQILVGEYRGGGTVDLYGPTKSDLVFGEKPGPLCLSDNFNQGLSVQDVVEVFKVSIADLKVGDSVVFDNCVLSNIGDGPEAGEVCTVSATDFPDDTPLCLSGKFNNFGLWFPERNLAKVGVYIIPSKEEKDVDTEEQVEDTVEIKSGGEAKKLPKPRTKPIYEVQLKGAAVFRTASRDKARRLKADLGGKEAGATIMQYNAVKEIR